MSEHDTLPKSAAYAAIAVSAVLIVAKLYAWLMTGSLSIFASLVDSAMDLSISAVNLLAIGYALKPADDDHRFGHTAIEDIAGLVQAAFIAASAVFVVGEAFGRYGEGVVVENTLLGGAIMAMSLLLTIALVGYQNYVYRKTKSLIIGADTIHYASDVLMNLAILISLGAMYYFDIQWLDAVLASLIALYMTHGAWQIGQRAFDNLMDKELEGEEKDTILAIIKRHEEIKGVHDLKTRFSGRKIFVQAHIELDGDMKLHDSHEIVDRLEEELIAAFPEAEVILHQDPV